MIRDIQQLKSWYEEYDYPTQEQFWDWLDSFIHKNEGIAFDDVKGLAEYINERNDALLEQVNKIVVEAVEKLQLERRIALTMERDMQIIPIGEPMTIYKAKGRNVAKLEIKANDDAVTEWTEIPLGAETAVELDGISDARIRITRATIDHTSTIYIFAKVKTETL